MAAMLYTLLAMGQFVLFFGVHAVIWRRINTSDPKLKLLMIVAVLSFVISALGLLVAGIPLDADMVLLISLPVFGCLLVFYLHLYVGVLKSVSLRIIGDLILKEERADTILAILNDFSLEHMVQTRLDLMVVNGWLRDQASSYECLPKAKRMAVFNAFLKKIYSLKVTG